MNINTSSRTPFWLLTLSALTLGHLLAEAPCSQAEELPKIESIRGVKTITLQKGGKQREVPAGTSLEYGEKVITRAEGTATVLYPDGSKINVSANTEFMIEEKTEGTQWNRLKSGSVRGIITKTTLPVSHKPKFIIRSRAAVLGVRGTDFVMAVGADHTALVHTLEGAVEVAKNELQLLSNKGASVTDGHFIEASQSGLSAPQSFDKVEYLKNLDPELTSNARGALKPLEGPTHSPAIQGPVNRGPPPTQPPRIKFPIPETKASREQDQERKDDRPPPQNRNNSSESKSGLSLLEFQAGAFYTVLPDTTPIKALNALWTPRLTLPYLTFLSIHPAVGASFAPNGSLNNHFLVMEYELFLTLSLFGTLYAEAGMGEQIWRGDQKFDAGLFSVNAGILIKAGIIDRIFVGYQLINFLPVFNEYKAGIGFKL